MVEKRKNGSLYYGWIIVIVGFFVTSLCVVPNSLLGGLYVQPLVEEFDSNRTAVVLTMTLSMLGLTFGSLFSGRLIAKLGVKTVMLPAMLIFACCFLLTSFATSLTAIYILSFARGMAASGCATIPLASIINQWFGPKYYGRAMSIAVTGMGVGMAVLTPITTYIIQSFSWRAGYRFFFALQLIMIVAVAILFVQSPQQKGLTRLGEIDQACDNTAQAHSRNKHSLQAILFNPIFWIGVIILSLLAALEGTWNSHSSAFMGDIGVPAMRMSFILSSIAVIKIVTNVIVGIIADKRGPAFFFYCLSGLFALLFIICLFAGTETWFIYLTIPLMGLCDSCTDIGTPLLANSLFPDKENYSTVVGWYTAACSLGAAFLPLGIARIFDSTGSYNIGWGSACVICVVIFLFVVLLYKRILPQNISRN